MTGCLRSCLGRAVALVLLAGAALAAWRWGPEVWPGLAERLGIESPAGDEVQPSPELAEETLDRLERLRAGEGDAELALGDAELSSVVRYALPGIMPPGVDEPTVRVRDGKVILSARVAVSAFPELPSLEQVVGILPDTVDIRMTGSLAPHGAENLALHVDRLEASRIPLPDRMIPRVLEAMGRKDRPAVPPDAMLIPLPQGLRSAYVLRDSLVLVADR